MPAIRGIYYKHPQTGEAGLWVMLLNGNVVGRTDAQIAAFVPKTGSAAAKIAKLKQLAEAYLQVGLEERIPLSNWSAEDQAWMIANPQPFCRIDGTDYVIQPSVVAIDVLSLSPLRVQITVSEGASRSIIEYA